MKTHFLLFPLLWLCIGELHAQTTSYQYDHTGRLINASYDSKKAISYTYDKDGNRTNKANVICVIPIADFTASQVSGNCPLSVDFTSNSTTQGTTLHEWTIYTDTTSTPSYFSTQNLTGIIFNYGGTFLVQLKVTDACGTNTKIAPGYITVICNPTSVSGNARTPSINVFPNPTHDKVTIEGSHVTDGVYSVEVSDVWGRIITKSEAYTQAGILKGDISLKNFASGTYFIKISSSSIVQSFKITKE